jgi:O-methyltransferase
MLPSLVAAPQLAAMVRLASDTPPGAFVEIGVYRGGSAYRLYEVALRQNRALHLFDTFEGTPFCVEGLDKHQIGAEFAAPEMPQRIAKLMPFCDLHVGVYPDTHPAEMPPVAFIHCDCDQYESYCGVILRMWPLVVPGGVLLFDDYPYLEGAKRAVEEHFYTAELQQCGNRFYVRKVLNADV